MKNEKISNGLIAETRQVRERLLKEANGDTSKLNKMGVKLAKKMGLKLSTKRPARLTVNTSSEI